MSATLRDLKWFIIEVKVYKQDHYIFERSGRSIIYTPDPVAIADLFESKPQIFYIGMLIFTIRLAQNFKGTIKCFVSSV